MTHLQKLTGAHGELFEYWAHAACLLPVADEPLFRWRMAQHGPFGDRPLVAARRAAWREHNAPYIASVLEEVRERGPIPASQLTDPQRRDGEWWGRRSVGRQALEALFADGQLSGWRNPNFERVYDLPERAIPASVLAQPTPSMDEAHDELLLRAARCLGVATAGDLAYYYMINPRAAKARVKQLAAAGRLAEVHVDGWRDPRTCSPARGSLGHDEHATLLSPFDSLIWERARTTRLFGFDYTIEVYVPEPKRKYGYYVLPMLLGDELVARFDLKADRKASALLVRGSYLEPGKNAEAVAPAATGRVAHAPRLARARRPRRRQPRQPREHPASLALSATGRVSGLGCEARTVVGFDAPDRCRREVRARDAQRAESAVLVEEHVARPRERDVVVGDLGPLGCAICTGWCSKSPVITMRSSADVSSTETCPGVWPGDGIEAQPVAEVGVGVATSSASPASRIGPDRVQVHRRARSVGRGPGANHGVEIVGRVRCRDVVNVGIHSPSARWVSQPTWSSCRCVCRTEVDTSSGVNARFGEALGGGQLLVRPEGEYAVLDVADTRIDERDVSGLLDQECLDTERDGAVGGREPFAQPLGVAHCAGRHAREEQLGGNAQRLLLDDGGDGRMADSPALGHARRYARARTPGFLTRASGNFTGWNCRRSSASTTTSSSRAHVWQTWLPREVPRAGPARRAQAVGRVRAQARREVREHRGPRRPVGRRLVLRGPADLRAQAVRRDPARGDARRRPLASSTAPRW